MLKFIKRLLCDHGDGVSFVRNIYGDEINAFNGKRSIWVCNKCEKHFFLPALNQDPNTARGAVPVSVQCQNINQPRGCWRVACQLGNKCREPERSAQCAAAHEGEGA